jgi:hypothetical protein
LQYDDTDSSTELASVAASTLASMLSLHGFDTPAWRERCEASLDALLASNFGASTAFSQAWFATVVGLGAAAALDPTPRSLRAIAAAPLDLTPALSVLRGEEGGSFLTFMRSIAMLVCTRFAFFLCAPRCFFACSGRRRLAAPFLLVCTCAPLMRGAQPL